MCPSVDLQLKHEMSIFAQFKPSGAAVAFESTQGINQHNVSLLAGIFLCVWRIIPGLLCHTCSELSPIPRVGYSLNTRLGAGGVYPLKQRLQNPWTKLQGEML